MINRLLRMLCRSKSFSREPAFALDQVQHIYVSGLDYDGRQLTLPELRLEDLLVLVRDPLNPNDGNAIRVETRQGRSVGFVNKPAAAILAPAVDSGRRFNAYVTGIEGGRYAAKPLLRIGIVAVGANQQQPRLPSDECPLAYHAEMRGGKIGLLLDGSERARHSVITELKKHGLVCVNDRKSTRLASDGHQYDWSLDIAPLEDTPTSGLDLIRNVFAQRWELHRKEEWARLLFLDEEVDKTHAAIKQLKADLADMTTLANDYSSDAGHAYEERHKAESTLQEAEKRLHDLEGEKQKWSRLHARVSKCDEKMVHVIQTLSPSVAFLRDSLRWAVDALDDPIPLMKVLNTISRSEVDQLRAKPVKTTKDWKELHFNTGHDDQGRIYFRRAGSGLSILISDKGRQNTDIELLRSH